MRNDTEYINSKVSICSQLYGVFDYNQTPITPLGTKAFALKRIGQRRSHVDHGKVGYVIGPSLQDY